MPDEFGLYLVLTDPVAGYEYCTEAAVETGVCYVQLRMKRRPRSKILEMAKRLRRITAGSTTRFIVNDDVEVARQCGADGVHVGQDDMTLDEARRRWPEPGKIFGLSTHNEEQEASARKLAPDYVGVGPVYPTSTKDKPRTRSRACREHHPEFAAHGCRHRRHQRGEPSRGAVERRREFLCRSRRHAAVRPQSSHTSLAAPLERAPPRPPGFV